jgi:putative intracellular protease/amidase
MKILSIVSSAKVGFWLAELTHPYWHFTEGGRAEVDIASPLGGVVTPDPMSLPDSEGSWESDDLVSRGFLGTPTLAEALNATMVLADVDVAAYDGVHVVGGAGAAVDLFPNDAVRQILTEFWDAGKVVGAICHGAIALANVPDVVAGKLVTGFSREEDRQAEKLYGDNFIPNFPEPTLVEAGAEFVHVEPWGVRVVLDGRLITGQNQQSASEYAIAYNQLLYGTSPVIEAAASARSQ